MEFVFSVHRKTLYDSVIYSSSGENYQKKIHIRVKTVRYNSRKQNGQKPQNHLLPSTKRDIIAFSKL